MEISLDVNLDQDMDGDIDLDPDGDLNGDTEVDLNTDKIRIMHDDELYNVTSMLHILDILPGEGEGSILL